jgi:sterol desaturase/sphingolipid hydroxylase (fatty acid hydroxylase superfamily)
MILTRLGYYSDFVVYPVLIALLAAFGIRYGTIGGPRWLLIFLGCLVLWTLLEYLLHRFAFHHMPFLRQMHEAHHDAEHDLIGSPIWISVAAHALLVFVPLLLLANLSVATAASAGLMLGYLWYVAVHHAVHHWHPGHSTYLYRLKRRHALHHHHDQERNFGVTTGLWDQVFGTADGVA